MNPPLPAINPSASQPRNEDTGTSDQTVHLHHARLVMRDGRRYGALTAKGATWVTTAAGCLLQPEVGDLVLVSVTAGRGYILTILERGAPESAAQVEVPGDLRLSVPTGKLEIHASDGVSVDAGAVFALSATQAAVSLNEANIACRTLHAEGDHAHTNWKTRTDVSVNRMDIATRAETHLRESVRRIAEHEDVAVGSQRTVVTEDWSVQTGSADLKARERVAVDAASVQIG